MGQLEKYGLYVLCLVIFLILGVALWGDPAAAASGSSSSTRREANVDPSAAGVGLDDFTAMVRAAGQSNPPAPVVEPRPLASGNGSGVAPVGGENPPAPSNEPKLPVDPVVAPGTSPKSTPVGDSARESYTVAAGDTLSEIASKKVGSVRFVPLLQSINPGLVPEKLRAGQKILLPTAGEIANAGGGAAKKAEVPSGSGNLRTHVVESGDTFEGIAERLLGDRKRVGEIKKLNATLDPTKLRIGQKILLPAK